MHCRGRTLTPITFVDEIQDFFCAGPDQNTNVLKDMALSASQQVAEICEFVRGDCRLGFIGSSILFIREAHRRCIRG